MGYDLQNIGATLALKSIGAGTLTAGGTGDATKVTGNTIDRAPSGGRTAGDSSTPAPMFLSASLGIAGIAVLTSGKKLSMAVEIQDSSDGTNFNTAVVLQASLQVTPASLGTTEIKWQNKIDVNLKPYQRYVRFNVTPDLDASGTDTANWAGIAALGGTDQLPVGQAAVSNG